MAIIVQGGVNVYTASNPNGELVIGAHGTSGAITIRYPGTSIPNHSPQVNVTARSLSIGLPAGATVTTDANTAVTIDTTPSYTGGI